jgi:hypothetical protein
MFTDCSSTDRVIIQRVSDDVGMGVLAKRNIASGERIYTDKPLVSIQHTANRRFVNACQNCHVGLGSIRAQISQILSEERFQGIDLSCLPDTGKDIIYCGCGEIYCSIECASEAFNKHHRFLCVSETGASSQAVSDFKFYCLSIEGCGDNLLLLAQLLCVLVRQSEASTDGFEKNIQHLLSYTNRPFHEVARPPSGSDRDTEWIEWLETTIGEAFELLRIALSPQHDIFSRFFSNKSEAFLVMSRLLAMFELNNIDISIPSKLSETMKVLSTSVPLVPILREKEVVMRLLWNDEARGIYEEEDGDEMDDEEEEEEEVMDESPEHHGCGDVDEMIEQVREQVSHLSLTELLDCEYPDFHGTGFFTSVARTNHSCEPNVGMDFDDGNAVVSCKALRDMVPGQELRMSYIARPEEKSVAVRQGQLKDYLFDCRCSRCI